MLACLPKMRQRWSSIRESGELQRRWLHLQQQRLCTSSTWLKLAAWLQQITSCKWQACRLSTRQLELLSRVLSPSLRWCCTPAKSVFVVCTDHHGRCPKASNTRTGLVWEQKTHVHLALRTLVLPFHANLSFDCSLEILSKALVV